MPSLLIVLINSWLRDQHLTRGLGVLLEERFLGLELLRRRLHGAGHIGDTRHEGVRAGRKSFLAGRILKKAYASASSPLEGVVR